MKFWILATLYIPALAALPTAPEAAHGQAAVIVAENGQAMEISVSDQAILHFESFHVGRGEGVRFIQPSNRSTVLSRVTGKEGSEILGRIEANGRLFLVNPQGIYFGKEASVNAGSFIASTLAIRDEDFLAGHYCFFKEGQTGAIVNEGAIGAEAFIALLGPVIENRGSIVAGAGKVVIGAGERVALDFTGDGLIQFTVEGELERTLIENYGAIEGRGVALTLRAAKSAMQTVVNTDGVEIATAIEEANGVIRLVGGSQIVGETVIVEGERVAASGTINAPNGEIGGRVELLGDRVELWGAEIDASGDRGGGTVLIGGAFQGKGEQRNAKITQIDAHSTIRADA